MMKGNRRRFGAETILLAVEVGAIVLFVVVGLSLWQTQRELNSVYRNLQKSDPHILSTLLAEATPDVASQQWSEAQRTSATGASPEKVERKDGGGTTFDQGGKGMAAAEQADVADQSMIALNMGDVAEKRAPETRQPRRLEIPAIGVDSPVFQVYSERWLKLGVVQVGEPVEAGAPGNLVLAGHNNVYGEVFRDLDELEVGHEIVVMTDNTSHTYRVRETLIVEPDDVWVTLPTSTATLTLVSCYPYLTGTQRIVVFADLVS